MLSRSVWLMIAFGGLISLLAMGIRTSFGLFLIPMSDSLGWGREIFAFALAIQNIVWGLGQPFAGMLADKYGSGRTIFVSAVLYILGLYLMSETSSPTDLTLSVGVLVGLGLAGASFGVVLGSVGRAVPEEKRSMALGIVGACGSLGQFVMVPLGQAFLVAYGWQTALLLLAAISLIMLPASAGVRGKADSVIEQNSQSMSQAIKMAFTHQSFWLLFFGFFVCGFHVAFVAVHLPAYIIDRGLALEYGATALAVVGLFNVIGSLLAGYLGGKYSKKYLLSSLYLLRSVIFIGFILMPISLTSILVFAASLGLLWLSTVPLTSGLVAQMFGPKYMTTLFGFIFFSHQIGSFIGVWLGGYLFDITGSYDVIWWISVALGLGAALLHWPIREETIRPAASVLS